MTSNPLDNLRAAMFDAHVDPTHAPFVADGNIRRFHNPVFDKPGVRDAWLTLFDNGDGSCGAAFGHWGKVPRQTWHSGVRLEYTTEQRRAFVEQMRRQRESANQKRRERHEAAARQAKRMWHRAPPADPDHPYLARKKIKPYGLRQEGDRLLVPVLNGHGELRGLQQIDPEGNKKFLGGTEAKGHFYTVGKGPGVMVIICEGPATGHSIFEATVKTTVAAFSASNLKPVAELVRRYRPEAVIILAADADETGIKAATEAAEAVGGTVAFPPEATAQQK